MERECFLKVYYEFNLKRSGVATSWQLEVGRCRNSRGKSVKVDDIKNLVVSIDDIESDWGVSICAQGEVHSSSSGINPEGSSFSVGRASSILFGVFDPIECWDPWFIEFSSHAVLSIDVNVFGVVGCKLINNDIVIVYFGINSSLSSSEPLKKKK